MNDVFGIAAFRSRQQVMRFESALRREGLQVSVVSTPRDVAIGCGLSVRFAIEDTPVVQRVLGTVRPSNLIGLYKIDHTSGRSVLTALSK